MTTNPIKVLLIEDTPFEARLIQIMLTETLNEKVDLLWANRLSTGLEHLSATEFDVLLLDLGLPDSWGLETLGRIHSQVPYLPVVVLTGCEDEDLARQAVQMGAQDYLFKQQINGPLLLRTLSHAIQRQKLVAELEQQRRELEQRATQLAFINDISSKIAAVMDLESLLDKVARLVSETFSYHHVALFLLEGDLARLKAIAGSYATYFPPDHYQKLSQGIIGWVATHGEKVVANDVNLEPRYISLIADRSETRAELCLPIKITNRTVGVLDIQSLVANAFGQNAVMAMETLTDQIAVAIENSRLYEAMQHELIERKQAEIALQKSEQRFRQVISSISDHIYMTEITPDGHHENIYLSPHIEQLTGYALGRFMADWSFWPSTVIHPDDQAIVAAQMDKLVRDHSSETEYRLVRADGNVIWVRDSSRSEKNPARNGTLIYGVVSDITKRKLLESQLVQAQKLEAIGQLAAGIAHEINTPIQYIGDNVSFVQNSFTKIHHIIEQYEGLLLEARTGRIPAEVVAGIAEATEKMQLNYLLEEVPLAIRDIQGGVDRVAGIVKAMKEFSHPGVEEKVAININQAIESTLTIARNEWKYVAEVETNFDLALPAVCCLPGELNQAILNVIVNAAHAIADVVGSEAKDKGKITVTTQQVDNWVEIRISDTGPGIPVNVREKIFNPFFTTKQIGRGSGQGLAIAHAVIVGKHGGKITFETEPGQGTTFIICLPIDLPTTISL